MFDDKDVIGVMANEDDGRSITVIAADRGSLTDFPIAVFRTLDEKRLIAAVDKELMGAIASQRDAGKIMGDLGQVIGAMAEALQPLDTTWIYDRLDK